MFVRSKSCPFNFFLNETRIQILIHSFKYLNKMSQLRRLSTES